MNAPCKARLARILSGNPCPSCVPLKSPDPEVLLPLKQALDMICQRGLYHLSIDYAKTPAPPEFSGEDTVWMRELVNA